MSDLWSNDSFSVPENRKKTSKSSQSMVSFTMTYMSNFVEICDQKKRQNICLALTGKFRIVTIKTHIRVILKPFDKKRWLDFMEDTGIKNPKETVAESIETELIKSRETRVKEAFRSCVR